uniref:Tyrosine--tRNA ligase n=1 Tax=Oryza barthii TaxID=65489 RepID=A0A0D3G1T6_9ORYZ
MEMGFDEKFALLRSIAEECICEDELRVLLKKKPNPICYGIMKTIYVNKMRNPRFTCNLNKIQAIIRYNIMMWKAVGMHHDKVEIIWFSDELNHHAVDYWPLAMDVSRKYTMKRMASYCKYVEPYGPGILPAAQIIYPCMLVSAVLCHKADIWLFSMDLRDIVMLTRDYCEDTNRGNIPTIFLHSVLPNLLENPEFQNRRNPGRTIFMLDDEDDIEEKISCAFCPSRVVACNPCLEYIKSVVLPWFGKFEVVQKEGNGSNKTYSSMKELIADYESGDLDSFDVKLALGKAINDILELVSEFFRSNEEAQAQIVPHRLQDEIGADIQKIQLQNEEMSGHVASTCQGISEKKNHFPLTFADDRSGDGRGGRRERSSARARVPADERRGAARIHGRWPERIGAARACRGRGGVADHARGGVADRGHVCGEGVGHGAREFGGRDEAVAAAGLPTPLPPLPASPAGRPAPTRQSPASVAGRPSHSTGRRERIERRGE